MTKERQDARSAGCSPGRGRRLRLGCYEMVCGKEGEDGRKSSASDDRGGDALLAELAEANNTARRFAAEELRQLRAFSFLRMGLRVVGAVLAVCAAAKFCHLLFEQALENVVFQHVFF